MTNKKCQPTEISGFLLVSDYDRRGNIIELMIETEHFDRYIIAPDKTGRKLWAFLNQKIKLTGRVTGENLKGAKVFQVESYEMLSTQNQIKTE